MNPAGASMVANNSEPLHSNAIRKNLRLSLSFLRAGESKQAEAVLKKVLAIDPQNADALHLLGMIAYDSGILDRALKLIQRAVSVDSIQPMFHHNLGNVLMARGDLEEAAACFQKAIHRKPEYADAHYGLAKTRHLQGCLNEAIAAYQKALSINPDLTEALINLGQAFHSQGSVDRAIACYRRVIRLNPDDSAVNLLLAAAYMHRDQPETARSCLEKILSREPANVDALFKYALMEEKLNRLENAVDIYLEIIDLDPNRPEIFINLGRTYKTLRLLNRAVNCYQKALNINPDMVEVHNNLGTVLLQQGRNDAAIRSFRKALAINPGSASALNNLGNALQKIGQLEEAIDCYRTILAGKPDYKPAYYHLGLIYQTQKKHALAIECLRQVLLLDPNHTKAACYLFHQLQQICDWREFDELGHRIDKATIDALNKSVRPEEPPFLSVSRRMNPLQDLKIARAWSVELAQQAANTSDAPSAVTAIPFECDAAKQKIRVGYLSNNFKNHPTGHLLAGMFGHHRRDKFVVNCYSFGEDDRSEFKKKIQKECDQFIEIGLLGHSEAADRIRHDHIDILIDLVGFTHGHRLQLAALRPAPIQVRWLGMAGTTGADFFDYIILDPTVAPQDQTAFYSEKCVLMPHCYQVNNRDQSVQNKWGCKEELELPANAFVFCCFCSSYKLDPVMFDAWMRILKNTPDSVLWLMGGNKTVEKNLKTCAGIRGVKPDRLVFGSPLPKAEHLGRLQHADLALDTRIVNGAATTSDALWAGVPVLTLQGTHFASRMSSGILTAVGMPELITRDLQTYEALAVSLAQNSGELNDLRAKLAINRLTKPLFDTPRFTANLERAYKRMWKIFLAGEKPQQIRVTES